MAMEGIDVMPINSYWSIIKLRVARQGLFGNMVLQKWAVRKSPHLRSTSLTYKARLRETHNRERERERNTKRKAKQSKA